MFKNIGGKIKKFAKVVCWLGIIASVIGGAAIALLGVTAGSAITGAANLYGDITVSMTAANGSGVSAIVSGVMLAVVGSLVSWVGSFMTYGFGELIDNSAKMVAILKKWEN